MPKAFYLPLLALALALQPVPASAQDDKALRKQRQEAQKERQTRKNERNQEINERSKTFREFVRGLKKDYQEKLRDLDTEFKLRAVDLKAEHATRVAGAEAEYRKNTMGLFMQPGIQFDEQTIEKLQADSKNFADQLFALKKQSAEELHQEEISTQERKNALMSERDRMALEEAASLGLTGKYPPLLATPIGDGLTKQEESWNERERKEVTRLEERNRRLLGEFNYGDELRAWELENLNEDFKLTWDEKAALHALDSRLNFYNAMFLQAAQGGQVDQQKFMAEMAEVGEQKQRVRIESKKLRDRARILRREQRKEITRVE